MVRVALVLFSLKKTLGLLPDWPSIVLLVIFLLANAEFLLGRRYIPFDSSDFAFPQVLFVVRSLLRGDAPWWNPLVYAGLPVFGDPQGMIFTPHVLVGLICGRSFDQYAFDLTTLCCAYAGSLALLCYGEGNGSGAAFGLLGAVLFMFGGSATGRLQHVNEIVSYSLLPVLLLAVHYLCSRPGALRAPLVALSIFALLINPNQVAALGLLTVAILAIPYIIKSPRPARAASWLAACGCVALLAALPQLAAIRETIAFSTRASLTLSSAAGSSMPPFSVLASVLPGLYQPFTAGGTYWAPIDITEAYLYTGIAPMAALLLAVYRFRFLTLAGRTALLMLAGWALFSLGLNGPVFPFLFTHVPGFSFFKRPTDATFVMNFLAAVAIVLPARARNSVGVDWLGAILLASLGVLAALLVPRLVHFAASKGQGAELAWSALQLASRAGLAAALGLGVWLAAIYARGDGHRLRTRGALAVLVAGCTAVDLCTAGRAVVFTGAVDKDSPMEAYRAPEQLLGQNDPLQAIMASANGTDPYLGGFWRSEPIGGNLASPGMEMHEMANTQGYNPVKPSSYERVFGAENLQRDIKTFSDSAPNYSAAPYRWIGLRYVLLNAYIVSQPDAFGAFGSRLMSLRANLQAEGGVRMPDVMGYELWRFDGAYPKASIVKPEQTSWEALPASDGECGIESFRNTRIAVDCNTPRAGRLVLAEAMAPGWRACVNGTSSALSSFGGVLRSVLIPAGRSTTLFIYQPVPFWRGGSCTK